MWCVRRGAEGGRPLTKNSRSRLGVSAQNAYPTDSRGSTAAARASCTEATVIRMSMIGFALRPGIAVLPKCSMARIRPGGKTARTCAASSSNRHSPSINRHGHGMGVLGSAKAENAATMLFQDGRQSGSDPLSEGGTADRCRDGVYPNPTSDTSRNNVEIESLLRYRTGNGEA
jgi:hypothetical protein